MRIQHFVFTRFNVRFAFFLERYGWSGGDSEYLERRFALFEKYCLPAMKMQSVPFRWLVLFSSLTPDKFKDRARGYAGECPSFEAVFVDDATPIEGSAMQETFYRYIEERLNPDAEWVISSRIDNDDAFNVKSLSWIRQSAEEFIASGSSGPFFVAVPNGNAWLVDHGFTQTYSWVCNHFPSLVCPKGDRRQVMSVNHTKVRELGLPIVSNHAEHAWLEIVSGTNLKNAFRPSCPACRMSARELKELFAIDADIPRCRSLRFYWTKYLPARIAWLIRRRLRRFLPWASRAL